MDIIYRQGNLLDAREIVILHGTNARGVMGSGVARQIRARWPNVYEIYALRHRVFGLKLGEIVPVRTPDAGAFWRLIEEYDVKPIPAADGEYRTGTVSARTGVKPIEITQPEGASFTLEGNRVRWLDWEFSASLEAQDGLVLHDVRYRGRRIMHRASCAEMIVPYGDPHPMHNWRTYFDAGDYGLGACTNSLVLGCDCLGEITYLDAHLANGAGDVVEIANAICLHEEDYSLLWKHTDHATGHVETRRARKFVVNSMATVGVRWERGWN